MLVQDMVGDRELTDVVQKTRSREHPKLGSGHRQLASNLYAQLGDTVIVAERFSVLDHVAEDEDRIQPLFNLRNRM
jgi:hypothetical protein